MLSSGSTDREAGSIRPIGEYQLIVTSSDIRAMMIDWIIIFH